MNSISLLICGILLLFTFQDSQPDFKFRFHHEGPATGFEISNSGEIIGTYGWDHKIKLWSLRTGKQIGHTLEHEHWIYSIRFSQNDKTLATSGGDGYFKLWSIPDCKNIAISVRHPWAVFEIMMDDPEKLIAASTDRAVTLWNLRNEKLQELGKLPHKCFTGECAILDNVTIVTSGTNNVVQLWNITKPNASISQYVAKGDVTSLLISKDRNFLCVCDKGGGAVVLRPKDFKMVHDFSSSHSVYSMAISNDSKCIAVGDSNGEITVASLAVSNNRLLKANVSSPIKAVALSADGKKVICGCTNGHVYVGDCISSINPKLIIATSQQINKVSFVCEDNCIVVANGDNEVVVLKLKP